MEVVFTALLAGALLFVLSTYPACRMRPQGQLTACKSNLKNMGTACELYSTDNRGLYPRYPEQLIPKYLKAFPTCPSARRDTYSAGFRSGVHPDTYTFFCQGGNHTDSGEPASKYPQYNSTQALVT